MGNETALPRDFLVRMRALLGAEFDAFYAALQEPPWSGLRVNTLKLSPAEFAALSSFPLTPIPWCPAGFFLPAEQEAGRHPFHVAGLYYLQEPSAMAVAELLAARPGECVLDLCAAPGGKATHLAAQLGQRGLLVANEIVSSRAHILAENLERWGARNAIITAEAPERLAAHWPGYFDRVLVDAPCSGEGMFRKSEAARREWRLEQVWGCALRQGRILDQAALLVRPGGILAYATCTFAPEENEGVIVAFLRRHPDFEVISTPRWPGFAPGRPEWVRDDGHAVESLPAGIDLTVRLWPHLVPGEGHFIALLRRHGDEMPPRSLLHRQRLSRGTAQIWRAFCAESLCVMPSEEPVLFGDSLYHVPDETPNLAGLRVLRPGWRLGTVHRDRFEPSHALALGLAGAEARHTLDLQPGEERLLTYLKGGILEAPGEDGWVLITIAGYPLGWGKRVRGVIKNHYPRAWRWA